MQPPRDYEIRMECPKCKRQMNSIRDKHDPHDAVLVHIQCPECNAGDFDCPHYFDKNGDELTATP